MATKRKNQNSSLEQPALYGAWGVTKAEYQAARLQARGTSALSEGAFQVVRYCEGQPFYADVAREWLQAYRVFAPIYASEALS